MTPSGRCLNLVGYANPKSCFRRRWVCGGVTPRSSLRSFDRARATAGAARARGGGMKLAELSRIRIRTNPKFQSCSKKSAHPFRSYSPQFASRATLCHAEIRYGLVSGPRRLAGAMRHSDGKAPISPSAAFEKIGPCLAQRRQISPTGFRIFDEPSELPIEHRHLQKKRGSKQGWGTSHDRLQRREVCSYCFPTR
jgi:hypothetical protein